jgi:Fe2+ or Zn2+ uptake regulation protein
VESVVHAIERYLSNNPAAADTANGIRGWWLPEHLRTEPLRTVVGALNALEARGVVNKTTRKGGEVIYSKNAAARNWKH